MTSLTPRPPYSPEELKALYPKELQLQLVQVVSRAALANLNMRNPIPNHNIFSVLSTW